MVTNLNNIIIIIIIIVKNHFKESTIFTPGDGKCVTLKWKTNTFKMKMTGDYRFVCLYILFIYLFSDQKNIFMKWEYLAMLS